MAQASYEHCLLSATEGVYVSMCAHGLHQDQQLCERAK
jgi:hypothetical protein